jgi:hypothetical protein
MKTKIGDVSLAFWRDLQANPRLKLAKGHSRLTRHPAKFILCQLQAAWRPKDWSAVSGWLNAASDRDAALAMLAASNTHYQA